MRRIGIATGLGALAITFAANVHAASAHADTSFHTWRNAQTGKCLAAGYRAQKVYPGDCGQPDAEWRIVGSMVKSMAETDWCLDSHPNHNTVYISKCDKGDKGQHWKLVTLPVQGYPQGASMIRRGDGQVVTAWNNGKISMDSDKADVMEKYLWIEE
ncbi:ricin-type beta-trefoil lectin domain protein [Nonomuraea lactucae]|uniref:ricin-type beta-trefoil lectin domain protein n=1 Tax=Nonomuraea lactucae TaxID=2249762 RepID=UPI0013B39F66|nr:ricin-type beta-trefoil lectin domain protein [Nonomuraea lactucae]